MVEKACEEPKNEINKQFMRQEQYKDSADGGAPPEK